jgi:pyruvate dehydrogenase complex dehydrogenase (E1) component
MNLLFTKWVLSPSVAKLDEEIFKIFAFVVSLRVLFRESKKIEKRFVDIVADTLKSVGILCS